LVVRRVDHPHLRLLADLFHMRRNGEGPDAITRNGALIAHAHLAEHDTRSAPGVRGDDFRPFLRALRGVGYDRRLSIEGRFQDLRAELTVALPALRRQLVDAGY
jgi:sugar phosphate isomerase/epimerase